MATLVLPATDWASKYLSRAVNKRFQVARRRLSLDRKEKRTLSQDISSVHVSVTYKTA